MIVNPIIPIWLMSIISIFLLIFKRKGLFPYIRQILMVILVFIINLRIMIPDGNVSSGTQKMDVNVLFVIDDTISMLAQDYSGGDERLTAVKEDCEYIIDELNGAKFSVISFHNVANLLSPFTYDTQFAKNTVNAIYPLEELYARGSSMNVCKDLLEETLENTANKKDGKVIVFFISDGEITNEDTLESFANLSDYVDGGAVLGYGTGKGGKMYLKSMLDDKVEALMDTSEYPYSEAVSKIDEKNLKKIASDMGIGYIHMTKQSEIDSVLKDIRNNAEIKREDVTTSGYKDTYYFFMIPLLLLLIYECVEYKRSA